MAYPGKGTGATQYLDGTGAYSTPASGGTWTTIATITTSASAATVDFTSIAGGYSMYKITGYFAGGGTDNMRVRFNNDSGANYNYVRLKGATALASVTTSTGQTSALIVGPTSSLMSPNMITILVSNSAAGNQKGGIIQSNSAENEINQTGFRWADTSAVISRITLSWSGSDTFVNGSKFILEGTTL